MQYTSIYSNQFKWSLQSCQLCNVAVHFWLDFGLCRFFCSGIIATHQSGQRKGHLASSYRSICIINHYQTFVSQSHQLWFCLPMHSRFHCHSQLFWNCELRRRKNRRPSHGQNWKNRFISSLVSAWVRLEQVYCVSSRARSLDLFGLVWTCLDSDLPSV